MFESHDRDCFLQEKIEHDGKRLPSVKVPDVRTEIFMSLIGYLYIERVVLNNENVFEILYAGKPRFLHHFF